MACGYAHPGIADTLTHNDASMLDTHLLHSWLVCNEWLQIYSCCLGSRILPNGLACAACLISFCVWVQGKHHCSGVVRKCQN